MCAYNDGSYSVFADSLNSGAILPNEFVEMSIQEGKVLLKKGNKKKNFESFFL